MHTEFRHADPRREIRSLLAFDRAVFGVADRFPREYWSQLESYWMLIGGRKAGCCAFEPNSPRKGSLYIATTGIHPSFRGRGLGRLMKAWELGYARRHKFDRVVTHVRAKNRVMVGLNKSFGFRVIGTIPGYYSRPAESAAVMEWRIAD